MGALGGYDGVGTGRCGFPADSEEVLGVCRAGYGTDGFRGAVFAGNDDCDSALWQLSAHIWGCLWF